MTSKPMTPTRSDDTQRVSTTLELPIYDAICRRALEERIPISHILRKAVALYLRTKVPTT